MGYIIAMSGAHGTGKTTAAYQKAAELKIHHPEKSIRAICDLETLCPYTINKTASQQAQAWLFTNQINQELTNLARFDIVVTDRTVVDVIGYTQALGFYALADAMLSYAGQHMCIYKKIYFRKIIHNPYCHDDGIRETEDTMFREDVEDAINLHYEILLTHNQFPGELYHV